MPSRRIERLNEQLKREITEILRYDVKDPRVGTATVMSVSTTADLSLARVHVSSLGDDGEREQTLEGVRAAASFIRSELGRRLRLRRVPELRFEEDRSLEHALRIERLLREALPEDGRTADEEERADRDDA